MTNDGLGPAFIKEFSVEVQGRRVEGFASDRWDGIIKSLELIPECFGHGWPRSGATIRPGVEVPLVFLTDAKDKDFCFLEALQMLGGEAFLIHLEYESIYGDRKTLSVESKIRSELLEQYADLALSLRKSVTKK